MNSFCAMNSLRMSFWIVPESVAQSVPRSSATTRYIASSIGAGPLIVIDVVTAPEVDVGKQRFHVGKRRDVDAALPDFAARELVIRVATHQRRQVEGDAETGAAGREQPTIALVGLLWRPEAGKLPHRPELAAVASGMNAARVREIPRGRPDRGRSRAIRCSAGCKERRGARIDYIVGVSGRGSSTVHGPQSVSDTKTTLRTED